MSPEETASPPLARTVSDDGDADAAPAQADLKAEIKELKGQIMAVKKSISKGDKKGKKEAQAVIDGLEALLDKKQAELAQAKAPSDASHEDTPPADSASEQIEQARARRRGKRERKLTEAATRIATTKAGLPEGPDYSALEARQFEELLRREDLVVFDMEPDGHCMFNAVAHQMEVLFGQHVGYQDVRRLAADRIAQEADLYASFIDVDESGKGGPGSLEAYCERVRSTSFWGGHVELDALSKALDKTIIVYQSDAAPLRFGTGQPEVPLRLCFQKFAYSLGEHYDSLVPSDLAAKLQPAREEADEEYSE